MTEIRKTFETNFFGVLAVARAFAPIVGNQLTAAGPGRPRPQLARVRTN
ncbi:hypothetical protein [Mycobacterium sp. AZCC_0083]|nr:hypothetical protein [Mycobacterium sp. AZCC_0083]MBB5163797.1 hypothetical protein [Mycobacterium sp. AZCC_0083]